MCLLAGENTAQPQTHGLDPPGHCLISAGDSNFWKCELTATDKITRSKRYRVHQDHTLPSCSSSTVKSKVVKIQHDCRHCATNAYYMQ